MAGPGQERLVGGARAGASGGRGPGRCALWAGPGQVRLVGGAAELKPCPGAGLVPDPWKPSRPAGHKEGKEGGMKEEEGDREGDSAWLL